MSNWTIKHNELTAEEFCELWVKIESEDGVH